MYQFARAKAAASVQAAASGRTGRAGDSARQAARRASVVPYFPFSQALNWRVSSARNGGVSFSQRFQRNQAMGSAHSLLTSQLITAGSSR